MINLIVVLVKVAIVTKIVSDIIKDIKKRVDSDQTDNPNDKELKQPINQSPLLGYIIYHGNKKIKKEDLKYENINAGI